MVIDRSAEILATLAKQGAPVRAVAAVEGLFARRQQIARERYAPERAGEEDAAAKAAAVAELSESVTEMELLTDAERDAALQVAEQERVSRSAERRELRDVVDVSRLRESDDPAEILSLVADAERHGDVVGAAAKTIALQRVRVLATNEQRRKNVLSGGPAFAALCRLNGRATGHGADPAAITARFAEQRKRVRALVLEVANVAGLASQVQAATVRASVPELQTPEQAAKFVVGSYWDRFPQLRQGR